MIDPADADAVTGALRGWLTDTHGAGVELAGPLTSPGDGLSTFIWFFQLVGTEIPDGWGGPLVLRIFSAPWHGDAARTEADLHGYVLDHAYPAPRVHHCQPDDSPFGLPFLVMDRAPGEVMLRRALSRPWQAAALLRRLAELHVGLHRLPVDATCPVGDRADTPLVTRRLDDLRDKIDAGGHDGARSGLAWLEANAGIVGHETPAFLHNDFHPLNVLIEGSPAGGAATVIDWSDADVGDRHHDVGRTLALFRVASIAADSPAERLLLRRVGPWMTRTYRAAYERHHPLDDRRLRYWQALHLLRGWLQVREIHEPPAWSADRTLTPQARKVPAGLADQLMTWFDALARSLAP